MTDFSKNRHPDDNSRLNPIVPEANRSRTPAQLTARHASVRAALCIAEASHLGPKEKEVKFVEVIDLFRKTILGPDGRVDFEMVEALRMQLLQASDPVRQIFFEWVVANPSIIVTVDNFTEVMKDNDKTEVQKRTPDQARQVLQDLISEWSMIIRISDPGLQLTRLDRLLAQIHMSVSNSSISMVECRNRFLKSVQSHRDTCFKVVCGELKDIRDYEQKIADERQLVNHLLELMKRAGDEANEVGRFTNN
jgi:hypothetical protein